jgi:hypothetical protein
MDRFLSTKFHIPLWRLSAGSWPRLLARPDIGWHEHRKLTLVSAPKLHLQKERRLYFKPLSLYSYIPQKNRSILFIYSTKLTGFRPSSNKLKKPN